MPGVGADGDRILYGSTTARSMNTAKKLAEELRDYRVDCRRLLAGDACYWVGYQGFIGANEWAVLYGPSEFGDLGGLRTTPGGYRELGPRHHADYTKMVETVKQRIKAAGEDTLVGIEAEHLSENDGRKCYFSGAGGIREVSLDQMAFIEQNAMRRGSWMVLPGKNDWDSEIDLFQFLIYWDEKSKSLIGYTSGWLV